MTTSGFIPGFLPVGLIRGYFLQGGLRITARLDLFFWLGRVLFCMEIKLSMGGNLPDIWLSAVFCLFFLEMTVIRFFWTFNLNFGEFFLAGVIWMLGWCMVLLAAFVGMRAVTVGIIGVLIAALQNVFAMLPNLIQETFRVSFARFWEFIYTSGFETWAGITILYVLVPWIGVMMAGYGFGLILLMDAKHRRRICLAVGLTAIATFLVVGSIFVLQQPVAEDTPPFIFQLLNQRKYPASQLYLLMTLGPIIALVPFAEKAQGSFAGILRTFGKVPMFFYLVHILLIHLSAFVVNLLLYGGIHQEWYNTSPYTYMPEEYERWGLPILYLVFVIDVILLYFVCRWYAKYKSEHLEKNWLKYI